MRFAIDAWAPEYGQPADEAMRSPLDPTSGAVEVAAEVPVDDWAPLAPPAGAAADGPVLFVDGVRRVDARVWVTGDDGITRMGICATWAAGVVECNGRATIAAAEVRRGMFCPGNGLEPIRTRHGDYVPHPVDGDDPDRLSLALQGCMATLEGRVAAEACGADSGAALVVLDGPLRDRAAIPGAIGYVKTHHVAYLPAAVHAVVGDLGAGQRTPLFAHGAPFTRWSCYLRLPGPKTHPWAGVVRLELAGDHQMADAAALADRAAATLPRFASAPHKDTRAPQNLHPIAGLERELRRRSGDPALLQRALRAAANPAA